LVTYNYKLKYHSFIAVAFKSSILIIIFNLIIILILILIVIMN